MKALFLHCDYFKFRPLKKAIKVIDELSIKEKEGGEFKNCLAVLIAIEKKDKNIIESSKKLVDNIKEISNKINSNKVVLYPYAHLSNNLASPEIAQKIFDESEKNLKKIYSVLRAPFGYYKEFEMKVKGHPLSELSREIYSEEKENNDNYNYVDLLNEISKSKLDSSKIKDNDHRIIGKQMDLFSFNNTAPGMVFWHNKGLIIYNKLIEFWREIHKKEGYEEIKTPEILDKRLWQISGHWEKYKDNIFLTNYENRIFAVKPMNCPGGMLIFKSIPKSYKDLPLRVGEIGTVHRMELSGTLGGLFRVIQFTQDDAHIYCTKKQMANELEKIVNLASFFYKKFELELDHIELSTRPKNRIGNDKMWDLSEKTLEKVLKKIGIKYKINSGDGAFYGPKIDFHIKDSLGRTWQCATVQLDFAMPERFNLEYTDKDNKKKRPVMIHRTIYGSLERFIGILLENTKGRLPLFIAPEQIRVLSFTDRNVSFAEKIINKLKKDIPDLRISSDFDSITISSKVKDAEINKVPYIIVLGDREEKDNNLAVRIKGNKKIDFFSYNNFVEKIKKEIEERK